MSQDSGVSATFAREGEYWTVVFEGRVSRVRDAKGLRYISELLRHPGQEIPALVLEAGLERPSATAPAAELRGRAGDAGPVLDRAAVTAYRRRAADLREELDEAEMAGDSERAALARVELEALADQLSSGLGLGGRQRRAGSPSERARLAVTKAIRAALAKLEEVDPALGRHLDRTIRTGTSCAYLPDPRAPVRWSTAATPVAVAGAEVRPETEADLVAGGGELPAPLPLVGREVEERLLRSVLGAAAAGSGGRVVLLTGEAGIGKSRLAQEAAAEASRREYATLVGRCVEADAAVPWGPFVEIIDQLARRCPDDRLVGLLGAEAPDLARLLPSICHRLPDVAPPAELPPAEARRYLERSVAEVLARIAGWRLVLVVVEDLHWADPASLAVLERLGDRVSETRMVLVVTCRADEPALDTPAAHTMERLLRHAACVHVDLTPLVQEDVAALVAAVTGGLADPALTGRLLAETGGNALFVVEMIKHLHEEGRLATTEEPRTGDEVAEVGLPASLRLVVGHRLRRLSPTAQEVLSTAAVVTGDVDVALLEATGQWDKDALADALDEAIGARLLVPVDSGVRLGGRLRFGHALVRHAVLAELAPMRRRRVHRLIADALLQTAGDDLDAAAEIADHLDAGGGDPVRTAAYHQRAARRALERFAYEDAAARLDRALALGDQGDAAWRARLLADRGAAWRSLGQVQKTMADWTEAVELLEAEGPSAAGLAGQLCNDLALSLDVIGRLDEALGFARRGLALVGPAPTAERCRLLAALVYALGLHGEHAEAARRLAEAMEIAEAIDDRSLRGRVLAARTSFEFTRGSLRDCLSTGRAAFDALAATGELWHRVQALITGLLGCPSLGQFDEVEAIAADAEPLLQRVRHLGGLTWLQRTRYMVALARTADLDALASATQADVEMCRTYGLRWLSDAQVLAGTCSFWRGDWDSAAACLQEAARLPTPGAYIGRYTAPLAWFAAWRGDAATFDALVAEHHRALPTSGVSEGLGRMIFALAEVEGHAVLGRRDATAALYPAVADALARGIVLRPLDLRLVEALAGLAAAGRGDWAAAERHLSEARRQLEALPNRREGPDLDRFEAMVLTWRGGAADRRRARALLERAAEGYTARGMPRHAAHAAHALPVG